MSTITIHQLEPDIAQQLEQRATQHGRTIELEIKAILKSVLAPKKPSNIDLATAINRRFADFGDFEIPENGCRNRVPPTTDRHAAKLFRFDCSIFIHHRAGSGFACFLAFQ